jgi:hypothetical protein
VARSRATDTSNAATSSPSDGCSRDKVTWQEAESQLVGVLENDHVVHKEIEVAGEGRSRSSPARHKTCLHTRILTCVRSSASSGFTICGIGRHPATR